MRPNKVRTAGLALCLGILTTPPSQAALFSSKATEALRDYHHAQCTNAFRDVAPEALRKEVGAMLEHNRTVSYIRSAKGDQHELSVHVRRQFDPSALRAGARVESRAALHLFLPGSSMDARPVIAVLSATNARNLLRSLPPGEQSCLGTSRPM